MQDQEIIANLKSSIALHREAKSGLVRRMEASLNPMPASGLVVSGHHLVWRTVYAQCSQWGHNSRAMTGQKGCWVIDGERTLGEPDCSFFDGSNQQSQFGGLYLDTDCTERVRPATAAQLREIARELPEALLAYAAAKNAAAEELRMATGDLA